MLLSIVIPAYNEGERISRTLKSYLEFYKQNIEIIVVLNACEDNTLEIVKNIKKEYPNTLKFLNFRDKILKGGAIIEGFKIASGELIGFVDADNSTKVTEFNKLFKDIDGFDGIIGSRWMKGSEVINRTFIRKVVSLGFILLVKIIFQLPFLDTQCPAKLFRKSLIKDILPKLKTKNMVFDVELLYYASKSGYKIKEIPIKWVAKSGSAFFSSPLKIFTNSIKMLFTLISLRLKNI